MIDVENLEVLEVNKRRVQVWNVLEKWKILVENSRHDVKIVEGCLESLGKFYMKILSSGDIFPTF